MAKTLDFNIITPPTLPLVMRDDRRTEIIVSTPSEQLVEELLALGVRRFICTDEDLSIRAYNVLKSHGLRIPEDVEIASLSDSEILRRTEPPISALCFDADELGRAACRELLNALNNEPYQPKPLLGYQIHKRGSTR